MVTATTALEQHLHPDGWKSLKDIAALSGISKRQLQRRCAKNYYGRFQRRAKKMGGIQYQVHLLCPVLPARARSIYEGILNTPVPVSPFTLQNFLTDLQALINHYTNGGAL